VIKKWNDLERDAKSFSKFYFNLELIRERLERNQKDEKNIKDQIDYLIMKTYFTVPYFPVFKSSTLRKDFNMAVYFRYCLLDKLRLFFKISWTSWFFAIISIFLWSVLIVPSSVEFSTYFMTLIPILGLIISHLIYSYMKKIFRSVVSFDIKDLPSFKDVEYYSNNIMDDRLLQYPAYIWKADDKPEHSAVAKVNFHRYNKLI
jgi:hypothetical protein